MYAIHPGYVISRNDGDRHYIGVAALVRLYELRQDEYIIWNDDDWTTYAGRDREDYVHLYPSYHGKYGRPDEDTK